MDTLNFVIENLFDSMAEKLFENPENVECVIKDVFQTVDALYCEEKAEQLLLITHPKKQCCSCLSSPPEVPHEVLLSFHHKL